MRGDSGWKPVHGRQGTGYSDSIHPSLMTLEPELMDDEAFMQSP